jgi:tetratricopeptide (TPR) repeat protein
MYIPMLGLLIIIGWGVKDFVVNRPRIRIAATVIGVIALLSILILTRIQVGHWQNTLTLFEYALNVTGDNDIAENNYGRALLDKGMADEAEKHLRNAVRITPAFIEARDNLALALSKQNKIDDAIKQFTEVLKLAPNTDTGPKPDIRYEAYANLGIAYNQSGRYEAAIHNWTKALELKPDSITVLNNLSWLLATVEDKSLADPNKAIEYAERACSLSGNNKAEILDTLAVAYASRGRFDEAKATAEKALNIAKSSGLYDLAGKIQKRMELYKADMREQQK